MRKKLNVVCAVFVLLIAACGTAASPAPNHTAVSTQEIEELIARNGFLEIFRNPNRYSQGINPISRSPDLTEAVTAYIKTCCKTPDEAVRLLRTNGFDVFLNPPGTPNSPDTGKTYERRITAKKHASTFLYSSSYYVVGLYINGNTVLEARGTIHKISL